MDMNICISRSMLISQLKCFTDEQENEGNERALDAQLFDWTSSLTIVFMKLTIAGLLQYVL